MSNARERLQVHIASIPAWRRLVICLTNYRKWKLARAYSAVACDLLMTPQWHLGDAVRTLSECEWADIYGFEMPEYQKPVDFEARAIRLDMDLDTERRHVARLEREIHLMKNTSIGLKNLREQKRLPNSI